MKQSKGSLTVEASIALTAFMLLVVTILSFGRVYRAQNLVSHGVLQTCQSLAIENYYRETVSSSDTVKTIGSIVWFAQALGIEISDGWNDWYASLGDPKTDYRKIAKETFIYALAEDEDSADELLKELGVVDGIDGIDFSQSVISGKEMIICVSYKVKLPFSFFGEHTLSLTRIAKAKPFKTDGFKTTISGGGTSSSGGGSGAGGSSGGGGR